MVELQKTELKEINGGGRLLWYAIGAATLLVIGIIDGLINPQKCRN